MLWQIVRHIAVRQAGIKSPAETLKVRRGIGIPNWR